MMAGRADSYQPEKRFLHKDGHLVWGQVVAALQRDRRRRTAVLHLDGREHHPAQAGRGAARLSRVPRQAHGTGEPRQVRRRCSRWPSQRARRHDTAVGIIFLDLDNFKLVNDSLGHKAGRSRCSIELAGRLSIFKRETDLVARQSGDEFLLLLSDLDPGPAALAGANSALLAAEAVAGRVHDLFRSRSHLGGVDFYVRRRSASASSPVMRPTRLRCSATPTWRCIGRRSRGSGGDRGVRRPTRTTRCFACVSRRSSGRPSSARAGSCTTSPSSTWCDGSLQGVEALDTRPDRERRTDPAVSSSSRWPRRSG